jgi:hypothetical protein
MPLIKPVFEFKVECPVCGRSFMKSTQTVMKVYCRDECRLAAQAVRDLYYTMKVIKKTITIECLEEIFSKITPPISGRDIYTSSS